MLVAFGACSGLLAQRLGDRPSWVISPVMAGPAAEVGNHKAAIAALIPMVRVGDSTMRQESLKRQQTELWAKGYLEAHAGTYRVSHDTIYQTWHLGPAYQWARLGAGNVPQSWLAEIGVIPTRLMGERIKPSEVVSIQRRLVEHADHQGYPFATLSLDSLRQVQDVGKPSPDIALAANLRLITGPLIRYDTMQIAGDLKVELSWLERYLRMAPNTPFSSQRVLQANNALSQLPWLSTTQPIEIRFRNRIAQPTLYANNRACNQVDGVVGLLPNEVNQGQLLVTGELRLQLHNLFRTGKTMILDWQSIKPESQRLNIKYDHPGLFGTPFELGLQFNLLKEDSTFLNRMIRAQLQYRYPNGSKLGCFVSNTSSDVLLVNPSESGATGLASSSVINYGLLYQYQNLDDALYTHRGWMIKAEAAVGQKTMRAPTNAITAWRDSLAGAGLQYSATLRVEHFSPVSKRWVWYNRAAMATLVNNRLVRNELYRLGGLLSLRGFNENYFFSSQYAILTSEMRYFADATTYFSLFLDQGVVSTQVLGDSPTDYPTGIGIGTNFTTGTGVFSINYALGRDRFSIFDLATSKIHIGVAARF